MNIRPFLPILILASSAIAQSPTAPAQPPSPPPSGLPVVAFQFEQHNRYVSPARYELKINSAGAGTYTSEQQPSEGEDPSDASAQKGDTDIRDVQLSPATADRIFALAAKVNYFDGNFDFKRHAVADTGGKTLRYTGSGGSHSASYNWSEDPSIQELTHIFQAISATLESERRLKLMKRFDRLSLNGELSSLEQRAALGGVRELQLIAPTLRAIADDASVMKLARDRAQRLLALPDEGK